MTSCANSISLGAHILPDSNSGETAFTLVCLSLPFEGEKFIYTKAVRAYKSNVGQISRQSSFTLEVNCRMEQDTMVQNVYEAIEEHNSTISGSGRFGLNVTACIIHLFLSHCNAIF